jgi:preprotein translocase subunit SecF
MINIIGKRYWFFLISAIVIIPGIISLIAFGLKPSNDFQSGTSMTLNFTPPVEESALRQAVTAAGYQDATIQHASSGEFYVSLREITSTERVKLQSDLQTSLNSTLTVENYATTSASVASQTVRYAIIAVIVAAVFIMLYISYAFRKMPRPTRWGICAVIALLHDLLVVIGIFSILGWAIGLKIDALFITGVLTVAGYSVHDTIVVFDRIRENMTKTVNRDFEKIVDYSINETFVRSLNTSLTVTFVLFALFLLGGTTIHYFVLVLLIGVITGTYSSICNASALLVVWENHEWRRFISWIPGVPKNNKSETKTA